jgi:hypothetical protein
MLGEFLREVLTAVFAPLERVVMQERPLTLAWVASKLAIAGGLLTAGILAELWRD